MPGKEDAIERAERAAPPREFVLLVWDALQHLYDPAHLVRHRLNSVLGLAQPGGSDQALRNLLLDAIEWLEPGRAAPADKEEREARPYQVLTQRYVAGRPTEEIIKRLHISPRQFRREHAKGLLAVATYLWQRRAASGAAGAPAELHEEVQAFGVQLQEHAVEELLRASLPLARALAQDAGLSLDAWLDRAPALRCLCDAALARQALLLSLSVLIEVSLEHEPPKGLSLRAVGPNGRPGIELLLVPHGSAALARALAERLVQAEALMAAQEGKLEWLRAEDGSFLGLRLAFQAGRSLPVLVIDDNENMLHLYRRYLSGSRYRPVLVRSAREAQEELQRERPAAIVLDVLMRGQDGWELLQELRRQPELADVPIVVCSVLYEPALARLLGAQGYLKKPVLAEDLVAALDAALGACSRPGPNRAGPAGM